MFITLENLIDIAERAISPDELSEYPSRTSTDIDITQASCLMERWERLVQLYHRDVQDFEQRLASLGLDRSSALERLRTRRRLTGEALPLWATRLSHIFAQADHPVSFKVQTVINSISRKETPLFPEILHPFINVYVSDLWAACPKWSEWIDSAVISQLVEALLYRLSFLCARVIAADVKQKSVLGLLKGKTPETRYQYYVTQIAGTPKGLLSLLQKYPVLGRLLITVTDQAISNTCQWFQRLVTDYKVIASTFTENENLGKVVSISSGLSDPHNGGQMVWFVEFASGLRLAYKPRSLAPDVAYIEFVDWLNGQQPNLSLKAATVLARPNYGWVQWIDRDECKSKEEISLYYRRQSAQMAVFFFLSGTDFHEENFIAEGAYPVPIDLEGLGSWALTLKDISPTDELVDKLPFFWRTYDSVFSTVMLPRWVNSESSEIESIALSAFTKRSETDLWPVPMPCWRNLNTDELSLSFEYRSPSPAYSIPSYQGQVIPVDNYVDDLVSGFTLTYRTILVNKDFLWSDISPLKKFQNLPTRALVRPTQAYADLLFWTTAPDHLTSGAAYDIALEMVCGVPIMDEQREGSLAYSLAEKKALWNRDIPYFAGSTSDCYLYSETGIKFGPINEFSGFDNIRNRIQFANETDLHWQSELIRASIAMSLAPKGLTLCSDSLTVQSFATSDLGSSNRICNHVLEIANRIKAQVVHHANGIGWLTLGVFSKSGMPQIGHAFPWTVTGNAGIAIFLANLAAYTGEDYWADLAIQAIETAVTMTEQLGAELALVESGLYYGISNVLYGLQVCATKLNYTKALDQAYRLVLQIPTEIWADVKNPDIISGGAANLLTLLNLYNVIADANLLERAQAVSRGILTHQEQSGSYAGGFWIPTASRPLLGMGHGAAGIVYALAKLNAVMDSPKLLQSIQQGLAYERANFNIIHQDWPNLWQPQKSPQFMAGYCGGAAGLGLARLEMLNYYQDQEMVSEINIACQATIRHSHSGSAGHHLCCGEAGRIIFLVRASQLLQKPQLLQAAFEAADKMLTFYEQQGHWELSTLKVRSIVPGLTDGIAGIGLALLTLLDPTNTSKFLSLA